MSPAKSISTLAALVSLVFIAGCASAPDDASVESGYASVGEAEDDAGRLICKREKDTGSRLSTRVCKTAGDWERERIESKDAMRNATKSPQGGS